LLRVYKRSPKVQLTFDDSRFWLGEVYRVRENETWTSLQEVIQEVEIFSVNSYADAHMTLWVKGAQLPGYFPHPGYPDKGRNAERDAWLREMGLGKVLAWPDLKVEMSEIG
jgi:hypothetical protein